MGEKWFKGPRSGEWKKIVMAGRRTNLKKTSWTLVVLRDDRFGMDKIIGSSTRVEKSETRECVCVGGSDEGRGKLVYYLFILSAEEVWRAPVSLEPQSGQAAAINLFPYHQRVDDGWWPFDVMVDDRTGPGVGNRGRAGKLWYARLWGEPLRQWGLGVCVMCTELEMCGLELHVGR